jgi:hypothetical protein
MDQRFNAAFGTVLTDLLNSGGDFDDFRLQIYDGDAPDNVNDSADGTLLIQYSLPATWCFYSTFTQVCQLISPLVEDTSNAGTARYFRILALNPSFLDTQLIQGLVSETDEGGQLQFDDVDWADEQEITINELVIVMPQNED